VDLQFRAGLLDKPFERLGVYCSASFSPSAERNRRRALVVSFSISDDLVLCSGSVRPAILSPVVCGAGDARAARLKQSASRFRAALHAATSCFTALVSKGDAHAHLAAIDCAGAAGSRRNIGTRQTLSTDEQRPRDRDSQTSATSRADSQASDAGSGISQAARDLKRGLEDTDCRNSAAEVIDDAAGKKR